MVNIYLFTLVLLHYVHYSTQNPLFRGTSYETVSGVYGDTITLTCRYNDRDQTISSNQIYWRKLDDARDPYYHRDCGATLFIYYAKLQDQGLYACYHNDRMLYGIEVVVKPDINMNLLNTREIPKVKEVYASPDEIVEITCEASFEIDPFAIVWRKSGGQLDLQHHFPRGTRLYLYHVKPQDSGDYSCYFYNYELTRTKLFISGQYIPGPTTQRPITYRPTESEIQTLTFNQQENVELICRIPVDIEPSSVTWRRVDAELDSYYHRQYLEKLFLYYVRPEDSGIYACFFENFELYRVRVYIPGDIVTQPPTYRPTQSWTTEPQVGPQKPLRVYVTSGPIRVREGDAFEISCRVEGSLPGLKSLLFKDQNYLGEEQGSSVYLRVASAKRSDEGRYLCYGFNEDRSIYEIESVDVVIDGYDYSPDADSNTANSASTASTPHIILTLDTDEANQEGYVGETRKVCTATTDYLSAPLTVDWYDANNVLIDENYTSGYSVEKSGDSSNGRVTITATLVLKNVAPPETGSEHYFNGGYYECRASLNGYTESKNFYFRAYTTHQVLTGPSYDDEVTDGHNRDELTTYEPTTTSFQELTEEPITAETSQEITNEEETEDLNFTDSVY